MSPCAGSAVNHEGRTRTTRNRENTQKTRRCFVQQHLRTPRILRALRSYGQLRADWQRRNGGQSVLTDLPREAALRERAPTHERGADRLAPQVRNRERRREQRDRDERIAADDEEVRDDR